MRKHEQNEIASLIVFFTSMVAILILVIWSIHNDLPTRNTVEQKKQFQYKEVKDWNLTEDLEPRQQLYYEQLNDTE